MHDLQHELVPYSLVQITRQARAQNASPLRLWSKTQYYWWLQPVSWKYLRIKAHSRGSGQQGKMCYLSQCNPHPVISASTPRALGTEMWIVISGCHKFTAQTALGYADRLSPQLPVPFQVTISYTSTGENVSWILFPSFGNHLLPPFQGRSRI